MPLISLVGLGLGLTIGLTGVGAGVFLTPFLILFLHVSPATAVGSSLVFSLVTRGFGSAQHLRQGTVDRRVVTWLAVGSLPAAVISSAGLGPLLHGAGTELVRSRLIGLALLMSAVLLTLRFLGRLPLQGLHMKRPLLVTFGVFLGIMMSLTSVGSGSIAFAGLVMLTPLGAAALVGTDCVHALLLAGVTAPIALVRGEADLALVLALLIGSIPGVLLGSRFTVMIPEKLIRGAVLSAVWSLTAATIG